MMAADDGAAECHSGWGPDADRHAKLLIHFISEGAHFRAYSHPAQPRGFFTSGLKERWV